MKEILLILLLQMCYVPMLVLRTVFMVKNIRYLTSLFGFMESMIYVFGLSLVFSGEQHTIAMIVYAFGFGLGLWWGGLIEEKLSIGFTTVTVNLQEKNEDLINHLRELGYGVTVYEGEGKVSKRYKLEVLTRRKRENELLKCINECDPNAFIVAYEPKKFYGGFLQKTIVIRENKLGISEDKK